MLKPHFLYLAFNAHCMHFTGSLHACAAFTSSGAIQAALIHSTRGAHSSYTQLVQRMPRTTKRMQDSAKYRLDVTCSVGCL